MRTTGGSRADNGQSGGGGGASRSVTMPGKKDKRRPLWCTDTVISFLGELGISLEDIIRLDTLRYSLGGQDAMFDRNRCLPVTQMEKELSINETRHCLEMVASNAVGGQFTKAGLLSLRCMQKRAKHMAKVLYHVIMELNNSQRLPSDCKRDVIQVFYALQLVRF